MRILHGLAVGNRLSTGRLSGHQANPASMSRSTGPQLHKRSCHHRRWLLQFWTDTCATDKNSDELADRNERSAKLDVAHLGMKESTPNGRRARTTGECGDEAADEGVEDVDEAAGGRME